MLAFALPLLKLVWKPLAILAAVSVLVLGVWAVKHSYDEGKREEGRTEVRAKELKPLQDQVEAARKRASALALQWDQQRLAAEAAGRERDEERSKRFADAERRSRTLAPAVAAVRVPGSALRVLDDAVATSNAQAPGPTPEPAQASPTPSASPPDDGRLDALIEWQVEVIKLYDACRDQVTQWQTFYRGLQAAN